MLQKENKDEIIEFLIDRIKTIDSKLDEVISNICYVNDCDSDDDYDNFVSCINSRKAMEEIRDYCYKTLSEVTF